LLVPSPPPRSLLASFALLIATVRAGLAIRFAPLGLPPFLVKYGGSALYAMMLYWVISTILPSRRFLNAALLAGALATAIEFFKLVHTPALDTFRLTLPGVLLLGRFFSVWDIAAYWLAIAAGALADRHLLQRGNLEK
jgi:hypothetical protein